MIPDRYGPWPSAENHLHDIVSDPPPGFTVEEFALMEGFVAGKGLKQVCQGASRHIGIISPNVTQTINRGFWTGDLVLLLADPANGSELS